MSIHQILVGARGRIKRGWTKFHYAEGPVEDKGVSPASSQACRFCLAGAVAAEVWQGGPVEDQNEFFFELGKTHAAENYSEALAALCGFLPSESSDLVSFNDHPETSKNDVLDLFDRAIEATKKN